MLIQAPTEKECESKMFEVVDSLNLYLQEFYPNMANAFRAGVSRLCEHPDCNAETAFYNAKQGYFAMAFGDADGGDVVVMKNWKGKSFVQVVHEVSGHLIDRAAKEGLKDE